MVQPLFRQCFHDDPHLVRENVKVRLGKSGVLYFDVRTCKVIQGCP